MPNRRFHTTTEAAELLLERYGVPLTAAGIRGLCEAGIMDCELVGGRYVISEDALFEGFEQLIEDIWRRVQEIRAKGGLAPPQLAANGV